MRPFSKRRYHRVADLAGDVRAVVRDRTQARTVMPDAAIDAAFRERLMLTVTEVNGCRYCSYAHARMGLAAGLTRADVEDLARGDLAGAPPDQVAALLYAQHWAEADGRPDAEVRERVLETYGEARTQVIELALRTIRIGNLTGNTWDYLLYRASRGRWGDGRPRRPAP